MIPAALRPAHEDGMARFLRTGEAFLVGRTIEITTLHADGSVFPVELSLTLESEEPMRITGVIRPI